MNTILRYIGFPAEDRRPQVCILSRTLLCHHLGSLQNLTNKCKSTTTKLASSIIGQSSGMGNLHLGHLSIHNLLFLSVALEKIQNILVDASTQKSSAPAPFCMYLLSSTLSKTAHSDHSLITFNMNPKFNHPSALQLIYLNRYNVILGTTKCWQNTYVQGACPVHVWERRDGVQDRPSHI